MEVFIQQCQDAFQGSLCNHHLTHTHTEALRGATCTNLSNSAQTQQPELHLHILCLFSRTWCLWNTFQTCHRSRLTPSWLVCVEKKQILLYVHWNNSKHSKVRFRICKCRANTILFIWRSAYVIDFSALIRDHVVFCINGHINNCTMVVWYF